LAFLVEVVQADPDVEFPGQDGVPDRAAPQHACITGIGVVVWCGYSETEERGLSRRYHSRVRTSWRSGGLEGTITAGRPQFLCHRKTG